MLADIGISRSDVADAFSSRFWEDPTALLAERAGERQRHRPRGAPRLKVIAGAPSGFRRPSTDRPARQAI